MKLKSILVALTLSLLSAPTTAFAAKEEVLNTIQLPKPPEGKAQVVWFRKGGIGPIIGCSVKENEQKISSLGAGRYFIMVTEPGAHSYKVASEATDTLVLELKPNETKFASCKIKMGIFVGRPDIDLSTEQEFRKAKSFKMVDADDMGPGEGALRPDQVEAALKSDTPTAQKEGAEISPTPLPRTIPGRS